eukprot:NODE_6739_length_491_cov_61.260181_g5948_i0.p2 GENE.NODE_6739_length_491_cov_61.260181_g5948_i0~~NODE_6739_length_491_cov_61.260181_g5948_i0.p2  ORF type:complete len:135 (+),score=22.59 NODE_6739_length_491_cov_61.260181_g5948_i0:84-488(+)
MLHTPHRLTRKFPQPHMVRTQKFQCSPYPWPMEQHSQQQCMHPAPARMQPSMQQGQPIRDQFNMLLTNIMGRAQAAPSFRSSSFLLPEHVSLFAPRHRCGPLKDMSDCNNLTFFGNCFCFLGKKKKKKKKKTLR